MRDVIVKTKRAVIETAYERWARWCVDAHVTGCFISNSLGYGTGAHQRLFNQGTSKGKHASPVTAGMEMRIERALWRYQNMDGHTLEGVQVDVFRAEYMMPGTQLNKADELRMSISTYKRYLTAVKRYLEKELFDDDYSFYA